MCNKESVHFLLHSFSRGGSFLREHKPQVNVLHHHWPLFLITKKAQRVSGVGGSRCNVLFNWGFSRLRCWKTEGQLGDRGLQPQLGLLLSWISAVFVIFPVTTVLALKPELYTCWDKVLTVYVRSKIGRATALFVLNVCGTMI